MRVATGNVVSMEYQVRLKSGRVVESSRGKGPIDYLHGGNQILPALERALEGLREGERVQFSIPPEEAYGDRKEDNTASLPRKLFPAEVDLRPGLCLFARASGGQTYPITVRGIKEEWVEVDLNHPLAGERLFFEVDIRGVRPAGNLELFVGKPATAEIV